MTDAERIAELEAKLAAVQVERDQYYGHLAGLFWSDAIDKLTGDDMQKMADECRADKAKLARYESASRELPTAPSIPEQLTCIPEIRFYIKALLDYAVAMKVESDDLKAQVDGLKRALDLECSDREKAEAALATARQAERQRCIAIGEELNYTTAYHFDPSGAWCGGARAATKNYQSAIRALTNEGAR